MTARKLLRCKCQHRNLTWTARGWPLCGVALLALPRCIATASPVGWDDTDVHVTPIMLMNDRIGTGFKSEISAVRTSAATASALTHSASTYSASTYSGSTLGRQVSSGSKIGSMIVLGNRALSQTALELLTGHKPGDPCTPEVLEQIRSNLLRTGNFGLHSVTPEDGVKVHSESDPAAPGTCKVIIEVDENDVVAGVNIKGVGPIKPEEIQALLHLKSGVVYNPLQFRRDYEDIQELYNRHGYAVTAAADAGFDTHNQLNVILNVVRVTEIRVLHNRKTKAVVVRREMHTRPNGYYNVRTLQEDRLRLLNLGLFEEVELSTHEVGPGQVVLNVDVKEKKVGTINGGFNYSAIDGLVGTATISDNNFRGLGESVSLNAQLGSNLQHNSIEFDYRRPWLDRQGTGLGLQIFDRNVYRFADNLTNAVSAGLNGQGGRYSQQQTGGALTLSRPLGGAFQGAVTLRGENTVTNPLGLTGQNAQIVQDGPLYTVGTALQRDTRDLIADPVRGSYQNLTLNVGHADLRSPLGAGAPEFGTHNFAKSELEYRIFHSLSGARRPGHPEDDRTSVAFRLLAGGAAGHLPFSEQYFLGGGESLRGYREDRFWGSNLLLSSLELRQPVAPRFKLVAFMDVGEAWGGDYGNLNIGGFSQRDVQPHVGTGVGIRVTTPLGALRIDLGFGDEGARAHFGFGSSF